MFRTAPGEARALIEDWINRPTLRELVEAYGGTWPQGDLEHVVAELAEFSKIWDYRSGKSRLMFHEDQDDSDPHEELTYRAAKELGLMNPVPPSQDEYDYMLILGGLATGVEPRVKYAAKLIADGLKIRKQIVGLGSFRELQEKELPVSRRYAPNGRYEIDHLMIMMAALLGGAPEFTSREILASHVAPMVWHMDLPGPSHDLGAYAAASSKPETRPANTADTYELLANSIEIDKGDTAVLITSSIYVPYQHLDAARILGPERLTIETIGLISPSARVHPPHAFRQEIRSMVLSANIAFGSITSEIPHTKP